MTDQPPSVAVASAYPAYTETGQPAAESQGIAGPTLFSIVIINHNYADYLHQAIASALNQTYRPLEVIVIDDGSSDNSAGIIHSFGASIIPVFQAPAGHVNAFNTGFFASSGDVIIFLDADDILYPQCVQTVVDAWSPNVAKIQYRLDTIDQSGVDQGMPFPYFPPNLGPEEVLRQSLSLGAYPWTVSSGNAFARAFLNQLLPISTERISKSPDGFVNKMAPLFGEVKSLMVLLGAYRVHDKNAWAQGGGAINPSAMARAVRFDALLHGEFLKYAAIRGFTVQPYDKLPNCQMLEYRLLCRRLAPAAHPFPGDRPLDLMVRGVRSAIRSRNFNFAGRLAWAVWFVVIAVAPIAVIHSIFRSARGQAGRSKFAKWMVAISRSQAQSHS